MRKTVKKVVLVHDESKPFLDAKSIFAWFAFANGTYERRHRLSSRIGGRGNNNEEEKVRREINFLDVRGLLMRAITDGKITPKEMERALVCVLNEKSDAFYREPGNERFGEAVEKVCAIIHEKWSKDPKILAEK